MTNHPNRSRRADAPGRTPAASEIEALRAEHGVSVKEFADLIFSTVEAVEGFEAGARRMHPAVFAYAVARLTGQIEKYEPQGARP